MTAVTVMPPVNFGMVENDLYRSGAPNELNLSFLETLGLNTVVSLGGGVLTDKMLSYCKAANVEVVRLVDASPSGGPLSASEQLVTAALEVLLRPAAYPILVCCAHGSHLTGAVVGCLRKLQHWSFAAILAEYERFDLGGSIGSRARSANQRFIEFFDTDLVSVPAQPPAQLFYNHSTSKPPDVIALG